MEPINRPAGRPMAAPSVAEPCGAPKVSVVALAGNPNVGKSTVFNGLTGMKQHTGNWPGKTVSSAQGRCATKRSVYMMVDIPGTYSLMAHSAEEEVARNFLCFGEPDAVIVVCDATCLARNLNLVLQTLEIAENVVVCVNLLDEAKRKGIRIDLDRLAKKLGVPVVGTVARRKNGLSDLLRALDGLPAGAAAPVHYQVRYADPIEDAVALVEPLLCELDCKRLSSRWLSLRLLERNDALLKEINAYLGMELAQNVALQQALDHAKTLLESCGIHSDRLQDAVVSALVTAAEEIGKSCVAVQTGAYATTDRKIDRVLTGKRVGYPLMLALLGLVFWLTVSGANYPSQLLAKGLFYLQDQLHALFLLLHAPDWLRGVVVEGAYRVLAWVVSVMLPPMAIFFPLFTLLEDVGYLPRVAYNLDKPFHRCCACGKQALTMWVVDNGMRNGKERGCSKRKPCKYSWTGKVSFYLHKNESRR